MRQIVWVIVLLCGMIQASYAQNVEIKGLIRNTGSKEIVEFANVVLQTSDSAFIAGTTSDARGRFVFANVEAGDYLLAVSSLGYQTEYRMLEGLTKDMSVGEILLSDAAVALNDVTVTASNQSSHSDRKIVFPSERQVKAATNGMSLLQQLMLPKVQVDLMSNEIKVPGGGEVQLRINGVKVEPQEIKSLIPSDILRVEFHDNPGLRYGNAEVVLDYIVRRPDTGGSFNVDLAQSANVLWGQHNISARVNHKKSEFSASYSVGPRDFYGMWRDNEEVFNLADGTKLHRVEQGEPGHLRMFMHNLNLNYSYQEPDKYLFNATVRYRQNNQPYFNFRGALQNVADPADRVAMTDNTSSLTHRPALDLYYQRSLKHDQTLVFNLVGTYNREQSSRLYQESRDNALLTDVNSLVAGDKYSVIGEAIYEKKLKSTNRLSFGARHTQSFSDNEYRNGHTYQTQMNQAETFVYGEFKGKARKLDYTLGVGATRSFYKQEGTDDTYQYYTFNPRLVLHYNLSGQSFVRLKGDIGNSSPDLSTLNAIDQIVDSLQIQRGNPNLKAYLRYRTELTYEYQKNIFYGNILGTYDYQPNAIMDEKFQEGNKIIQTWNNQKDWQRLTGQATLRVGPIKDILQVSFTGGVNHYMSHGNTYSHTYTNWFAQAQASATYKKFTLVYQLFTNWNWFYGETMSGGENIQSFMLNYRIKDLSLGFGALNPFTDNYKVETENRSQYASYKKSMYIKESSRLFMFNLSYNFSFGRKYKAGQKRVSNSDNQSGVMSTGK